MVERDRRQEHLAAGLDVLAEDRFGLRGVGHQVAVGQHRSLGHARGAAGVLQAGQRIRGQRRRIIRDADAALLADLPARRERRAEALVRDLDRRQGAVPPALHHAHDAAHGAGHEFRHGDEDHLADGMAAQRLRQLVREHVDHDQRRDVCIGELAAHLLARVEGVGVHQHAARLEDAEGRDRIAQAIRRLQRDAVALLQPRDLAQIDGEIVGELIDLREAEIAEHAVRHDDRVGRLVAVARRGLSGPCGEIARELDLRDAVSRRGLSQIEHV